MNTKNTKINNDTVADITLEDRKKFCDVLKKNLVGNKNALKKKVNLDSFKFDELYKEFCYVGIIKDSVDGHAKNEYSVINSKI